MRDHSGEVCPRLRSSIARLQRILLNPIRRTHAFSSQMQKLKRQIDESCSFTPIAHRKGHMN